MSNGREYPIPEDLKDTYEMVASGLVTIGGKYAMQIIERIAALTVELEAQKRQVQIVTLQRNTLRMNLEREKEEAAKLKAELETLRENVRIVMTMPQMQTLVIWAVQEMARRAAQPAPPEVKQ